MKVFSFFLPLLWSALAVAAEPPQAATNLAGAGAPRPALTNSRPLSPLQRTLAERTNQTARATNMTAAAANTAMPPVEESQVVPLAKPATGNAAPAVAGPPAPAGPTPGRTTSTNRPPLTARPTPPAPAANPAGAPSGPGAAVPGGPGAARNPIAPPGGPGAAAPAGFKPGSVVVSPTPGGGTTNIAIKGSEDDVLGTGVIRFQEADLNQVLEMYAEYTGRTLLRPSTLPQAKITLRNQQPLTRKEGIQALEAVLALNGIATVAMEEKFVKVLPAPQVGSAGGRAVADTNKIAEFGPFTTHIVQLKYADPTEIVQVLQPFSQLQNSIVAIKSSQILVLRDYAENIRRMLEVIERIDVTAPVMFEPVVIPIKYALAGDISQVLSSLTQGGGGAISVGSSGATGRSGGLSGGTMGGGMGSTMGGSSSMGGRGYQQGMNTGMNQMGTTTGMGTGGTGSMAGARSAFAQRLKGIMSSAGAGGGSGDIQVIGMAKIISDERTNSLLIFADKNDLQVITNIIAKLDVVLAQVLIEGVVAEVGLGDKFEFGVAFKQRKPSTMGDFIGKGAINPGTMKDFSSFGTNGSGTLDNGFTYVAQLGQDLDIMIHALASDSHAQIVQRPRILTSHAKEASIFVGQTRPYITGYSAGGGYYGNYSQYQQLQIGINLSILPFINSEGLVVMDIRQRVQGLKGFESINGNNVPITSDKEATAYVAVRDRDTVMLGGYIDSSISTAHEGVPWLKDIPLLGALFKSHSSQNDRTETVLLVRPTVLNTPEAAATATALDRDNMPGLRRAETLYERQTREEADKFKAQEEKDYQEEKAKNEKKYRSTKIKRGS